MNQIKVNKLKIKNPAIIICFAIAFCLTFAFPQPAQTEKELFDQARLSLFDRQYDKALTQLDQFLEIFPDSSYYPQVLFLKGKCYQEKKMPIQALENLTAFLKVSPNPTLKEEAVVELIDLYFQMYLQGDKKYLADIIAYLENPVLSIRYYAAFKLSYAQDKKAASRAVPVLKRLIEAESDQELADRAKIALMRIDPSYLKNMPTSKPLERSTLKIRTYTIEAGKKEHTFSINIPFALARLALDALPDKEKDAISKKGYNLDNILKTLVDNHDILKIEAEDFIIELWLE